MLPDHEDLTDHPDSQVQQGLLDLRDSKVHRGAGEHLDRVDFRVLEGNQDSKVQLVRLDGRASMEHQDLPVRKAPLDLQDCPVDLDSRDLPV